MLVAHKPRLDSTLDGTLGLASVAVVGAWDPLQPAHAELLEELSTRAHASGRSSVVIVLDPPPPLLMYGPGQWPIYHDVSVRVRLLRVLGADAVLRVHFTRADLDTTAAEFLDLVAARVPLRELWLGAGQALGSGPAGAPETVDRLAAARGLAVRRLPEKQLGLAARDIRMLLAQGRLAQAAAAVGRPPMLRRPEGGRVRLGWAPGGYRVAAVESPEANGLLPHISIDLEPEADGGASFAWPNARLEYLAFVRGPGDADQT